jgi:hypothetical protein
VPSEAIQALGYAGLLVAAVDVCLASTGVLRCISSAWIQKFTEMMLVRGKWMCAIPTLMLPMTFELACRSFVGTIP